MKWIIGGVLTIGTLTGCSAADDAMGGEPSIEDYSCADLAEEVVAMGENNAGVSVLKVRDPQITRDQRTDYTVPTGSGEVTILECRGAGVFSSGQTRDVRIALTLDADEDTFISWQALQ